jgi:E3 ubiquitin-protein ligase HUWE1
MLSMPPDAGAVPTYRSHRVSGAPRGTDDGLNPLLQRGSTSEPIRSFSAASIRGLSDLTSHLSDWVNMVNQRPGHAAVSFINEVMEAVGNIGTGGHDQGTLMLRIGGPGPTAIGDIPRLFGSRRPYIEMARASRDDIIQMTAFNQATTMTRWQEEARILFGPSYIEKTQRLVNSILKMLVPPAIEEEKERKRKEKEEREREEREKERQERERLAREEAENREKEARAEREAPEAVATASPVQAVNEPDTEAAPTQEEATAEGQAADGGDRMEGVETTSSSEGNAAAAPVEPGSQAPAPQRERVRATFRGHEIDITDLGIDLDYLNALPEELREEVLMQQLTEQRSQQAAAGEEPTEIDREFLEALPPDIRHELMQHEAMERRRRERDEARHQAAANGEASTRAEDMDPASFFASLDPALRNAVLLDQDEDTLAQLPASLAAEARALGNDGSRYRWGEPPRITRIIDQHSPGGQQAEPASKKPPRRQVVQMLDRPGVATLIRLLFQPQGSSRETLNAILHNICQSRQNRSEVVHLLLLILQEGSADIHAIERSFAHLSLRAKQPPAQKTPQQLKRTASGLNSGGGGSAQPAPMLSSEATPIMVIQQCLNALVYLSSLNPHIPSFFLTEHEGAFVPKSKTVKKGKGKEREANQESKYALNALLSLLDRKLVMENAGCMEQLAALLQIATLPLTILISREKKAAARESAARGEGRGEGEGAAEERADADGGEEEARTRSGDIDMTEPSAAEAPAPPDASTPGGRPPAEQGKEAEKPEEASPQKKERVLKPPFIPEHNLCLVINILSAQECSGKTFRDALSTINNLSAIPGAREVFGKELVKQALALAEVISHDLDELISQIQDAQTGMDVQAMALAKFSPASSDQAKLLRVLTALDYLFDPKRGPHNNNNNNGGGGQRPTEEKAPEASSQDDLLTSLYESWIFTALWSKLSDCLTAIRQRDNMVNVATILLPLVEALMVVCKNTTQKESSLVKSAKEFAITSPAPESRMESLFFRFTEDHRKILNDLVRANPRLMSGTFSLLVKNSKVLEFDNKRNYFTRRLHSRTEARNPQPPLQLPVRRDQVFTDSYRSLFFKSPAEIKYGKLNIRFHGEEGVDAGGVTREWFQAMSRQMFNPDYVLFVPVASDRTTFHPNRLSHINGEHLEYFKFIGRIIGKALYEGRALDCHFSRAVYKRILGKPVSLKDMETLDLDYYKSLVWMLENDISDIITETFSIETEVFGETQIVDLIPNGRNVPVTEENKQEYVQLVVEYRLIGSVKNQLERFLQGTRPVRKSPILSLSLSNAHPPPPRLPRHRPGRTHLHLQRTGARATHIRSARHRCRRLEEQHPVSQLHDHVAADPVVLARSALIRQGRTSQAPPVRHRYQQSASQWLQGARGHERLQPFQHPSGLREQGQAAELAHMLQS